MSSAAGTPARGEPTAVGTPAAGAATTAGGLPAAGAAIAGTPAAGSPARGVPAVTLGRTGITTSRIAIGGAGWPERVSQQAVQDALGTAFELGIRHIDLAAKYNTEQTIGEALRALTVPQDLVVSTKVCAYFDRDLRIEYSSVRPEAVERSVRRSMEYLGIAALDIVFLHDIPDYALDRVLADGGALAVLEDLKRRGLVRAVGIAGHVLPVLTKALESDRIDVLQVFHIATLLNRSGFDGLFAMAADRGVPIFNAGPYAGYILATGNTPAATYHYSPARPDVRTVVQRLEGYCADTGLSLAEAAVQYSVDLPEIAVTVLGSGKPQHVRSWAKPFAEPIAPHHIQELLRLVGPSVALR